MPTLGLAAYENLSSQELMTLTKRESGLKLCLSVERHCLSDGEILLVKGSVMPAKALMSYSASHQSIQPKPFPLCLYQAGLLNHSKAYNSFKCMSSLLNTALFNNVVIGTKHSFLFCSHMFLTSQLSIFHIVEK